MNQVVKRSIREMVLPWRKCLKLSCSFVSACPAAGTSWQFILLITLGYVAGIAAKFVSGTINWVLIVYFINVVCIAVNWAVYFRNRKLDEERGVIDAAESLKERRASRDRAVAAAENGYIEGVRAAGRQ